jgi:hypothetical protein
MPSMETSSTSTSSVTTSSGFMATPFVGFLAQRAEFLARYRHTVP